MKTQQEIELRKELKRIFAHNLKKWSDIRGMSQKELAVKVGVSEPTVSVWRSPSSTKMPESFTIDKICQVLDITPSDLLYENEITVLNVPDSPAPEYLNYQIPIFESVAAGFRAYTPSEIIDYAILPFKTKSEADETLCIRVSGDSMSPKIEDGDLIQVHKQTSVDSGDIAVVLLDGDNGLVKKVEYTEDSITLISLNLNYPPIVLKGREILRVSVVGKVKKIIREV